MDRATARDVIGQMYTAIGEAVPYIWFCGGPASAAIIRTILILKENLRDNLGANLKENLGANLWTNLWTNLKENLGTNLKENLKENLGTNLKENLGANLRDNLWANLKENLGDNFTFHFWGQHEAYWPAFYAWPDIAIKPMYSIEQRARLNWWLQLSKSIGWWEPFHGVVFVCDRPALQQIDIQGRLHREDGPAFMCRDGWQFHAWHGVRVPAYVVERPNTITIDTITAENNAEVRRIMIERYGDDRYIMDNGIKPVAHDEVFGTLYVQPQNAGTPIAKVRVVNRTPESDGTFRSYWLDINPTHYDGDAGRVPQAAVASTWRTTPGGKTLLFKDYHDYRPQIET